MGEITKQQIPAHLQQYMGEGGKYKNDFGLVKPSDLGVSFIKLCHGQSKEASPNWDGRGAAAIPIGTMFESKGHTIIPVGTSFIPLLRRVRYIYWIGRPGAGHMEWATDDPKDARIKAIDGLAFTKDPRTQKNVAPIVTEYTNYYVMLPGLSEPAIMSFYRTSMPIGKKLFQDIYYATSGGAMPMFSLLFKLAQPGSKLGEDGKPWSQMNPQPAGFTPAEITEKAKEMFELAQIMSQSSTGAELSQVEDDNGAPEPVHTGQTIDAQPRVVSGPVTAQPQVQQQAAQQFVQPAQQQAAPQQFTQQMQPAQQAPAQQMVAAPAEPARKALW